MNARTFYHCDGTVGHALPAGHPGPHLRLETGADD
jgi:hypothetical protein